VGRANRAARQWAWSTDGIQVYQDNAGERRRTTMTRSTLIVGALLAVLLLHAGPRPSASRANAGQVNADQGTANREDTLTLLGQPSKQGALYTTDQSAARSLAEVDRGTGISPLPALDLLLFA
jgi:hypothetical protein